MKKFSLTDLFEMFLTTPCKVFCHRMAWTALKCRGCCPYIAHNDYGRWHWEKKYRMDKWRVRKVHVTLKEVHFLEQVRSSMSGRPFSQRVFLITGLNGTLLWLLIGVRRLVLQRELGKQAAGTLWSVLRVCHWPWHVVAVEAGQDADVVPIAMDFHVCFAKCS